MLDLLQHGIWQATGERVAGQQQHRQAIGMGDTGSGDHVERAGTDRRGGHHDLSAVGGLGVADSGKCHSLFVLTTPCRQGVAGLLQGQAEAGHVAVPEDGKDPWEQRNLDIVDDRPLCNQVPHDRRGGCESSGGHHFLNETTSSQ